VAQQIVALNRGLVPTLHNHYDRVYPQMKPPIQVIGTFPSKNI
jgi:hypothetical protein